VIHFRAWSEETRINPNELKLLVASTIQDRQTAWQLAVAVSSVRANGSCIWYSFLFSRWMRLLGIGNCMPSSATVISTFVHLWGCMLHDLWLSTSSAEFVLTWLKVRSLSVRSKHNEGFFIFCVKVTFNETCHLYWYFIYTGCPSRNGQNFRRVFLMLNYTEITQNTYIQSWTVMEIMATEKCGLLWGPCTVRRPWRHTRPLRMPDNETLLANIGMQCSQRTAALTSHDNSSAVACVMYLDTYWHIQQ